MDHSLISQILANIREPALELMNNINRNDFDLSGPICPESYFKTSLKGQRIFKFQSAWYTRGQ